MDALVLYHWPLEGWVALRVQRVCSQYRLACFLARPGRPCPASGWGVPYTCKLHTSSSYRSSISDTDIPCCLENHIAKVTAHCAQCLSHYCNNANIKHLSWRTVADYAGVEMET